MITAARPIHDGQSHYYYTDGTPCWTVPNKSKPGEVRNTTVRDARNLGLLVSPTTICKLLHRQALVDWICEQHCLAVLSTPRNEGEDLDSFVKRVIQVECVQDQERDAAAERGRAIHAAIAACLSGNPYDALLKPFVEPAVSIVKTCGRVIFTERVVLGENYAGCCDCATETEDMVTVWDFKTGSNLPTGNGYWENELQLAAYADTFGNVGNKRIVCANLYISQKTGETKLVSRPDWQKARNAFFALLNYWKITNDL